MKKITGFEHKFLQKDHYKKTMLDNVGDWLTKLPTDSFQTTFLITMKQ